MILNDTIVRKSGQKNQPATVRHYSECLLVQMNKYLRKQKWPPEWCMIVELKCHLWLYHSVMFLRVQF